MDLIAIQTAIRILLEGLGIDPADENFKETPERVAKVYQEMCSGLNNVGAVETLFEKMFPCDHNEMIFSGNIKAQSLCPHHLLPVLINAYMGYVPNGRVLGLSKMPRLVELLASKPILQEQLTTDIAEEMSKISLCCGVVVQARHLCMEVRGVKQPCTVTITSAVRGIFKENSDVKQEFFELVKMSSKEV